MPPIGSFIGGRLRRALKRVGRGARKGPGSISSEEPDNSVVGERSGNSWAAFVAGDANIFFPALVSLVSLGEHNPGVFDRFMVFDGEEKTPEMDRLLTRYGITFISSTDVHQSDLALSLPRMVQERWPSEVFLNWVLPEHFASIGYAYSLKLDYDTLSLAPFPTKQFEREKFSVAVLGTVGETHLPPAVITRSQRDIGMDPTHPQACNVGIVVFDNSYAADFRFFERFHGLYRILVDECPDYPGALEQVCFAALVANMEHAKPLAARLHTRSKTTRNVEPGFTSSTVLLHFITEYKPWKPLTPKQIVSLTAERRPMMPFYRMVWLDYASRVDGFAEFCDQRPYSAVEIMNMANTVLLAEKKMLADRGISVTGAHVD